MKEQQCWCRSFTMAVVILTSLKLGDAERVKTKSNEYYCSINKAHTMCLYRNFDSMKLQCHDYYQVPPKKLEDVILDKHNSLRNNYSSSGIHKFTVPNMLALKWDTELADIAARWAWQCPYYEDDFRDVDRFKVANSVGILTGIHEYPDVADVWKSMTVGNHTFHELHHHGPVHGLLKSAFSQDQPLSLLTNPYFKHVGCAAARYRQTIEGTDEHRTILVCNYAPLDVPYSVDQPTGPPCSHCPSATICNLNSTYPNLCIDSLPIHRHLRNGPMELDEEAEEEEYSGESEDSGYGSGYDDYDESLYYDDEFSRMDFNFTERYCGIVCSNGMQHTLCKYQEPTKAYDQVVPIMERGMEVATLNLHNMVRNSYASGLWDSVINDGVSKSTKLPLAANMRELQWNRELAASARQWTMQCRTEKDECRDILLNEGDDVPTYVSQLIDATNWTGKNEFPSLETAFFKWYSRVDGFTADHIGPYRNPNPDSDKDYSSFAQIIWADSYLLGCAMALCRQRNISESLVVTACNYGPGGMIEGSNVYVKGGPCTHCKRLNRSRLGGMYCSHEFVHLCSGVASDFLRFALLALPCILVLLINPR